MKRLIWLPIAGFLLIAGAAVAAAAPTITALSESALASLTGTDELTEPGTDRHHVRRGGVDLLEQVLADLVGAGTITQEQSDAITDALAAEVEARRAALQAQRELWEGFLEDGVITAEEVEQLPADSPFRDVFTSIAEDGQVDVDQLRELRRWPGHGRGHGHDPRQDDSPDNG